jgi:predicted  nucleic acid-binding Zn-ribbon protein
MNTAQQLHELQELDLDVDQVVQSLEQVRGRLGKDDEVAAARSAVEAAREQLTDLERQQKAAEWEVSDLEGKIAKEEKRLYGGSVKNPRELMGLKEEVDLLKKKRAEHEEQLLAIMIDVDSAQQELDRSNSELKGLQSRWESEQRELSAEQSRLENDLASLEARRSDALRHIDSAGVRLYEGLRLAKQGRAVAKVEQGRCQGCRISLPVSDQQGVRLGHELVTCSNCGRILCAS